MPLTAQFRSLMLMCAVPALVSLAAPGPAVAETVLARYGVSILGLSIGTATVRGNVESNGYRVEASTKLSGLAALASSSKGSAVSTGTVVKNVISPTTYATTSSNSEVTRTVRMAFASGSVRAIDIVPPFEDKAGRIPLTEDSSRNVIDPMSAVIMGVAADQPLTGPSACNRSLPVFDGYTRFNVNLSFVGMREVKTRGYSGPVSVCNVRYMPIAGHRPERAATKFMINNKQIEVWVAPVEKAHVVVPYRISVQTQIGMLVIEAQELQIEPGGQAKAQ